MWREKYKTEEIDMNCEFKRKLPIPKKVKAMYPVTDKMREDFEARDVEIKN